MSEDAQRAAAVLRDAVGAFTERAVEAEGVDDELAAREWTLLRALADFREALASPGSPEVLGWVPPVDELPDDGTDKVMQVATWFFAVSDPDQVVVAGRERVAAVGGDAVLPVRTVSDVVSALADAEIDWPDPDGYGALGLDVQSAHFFTQVLHPER